MNILTKPRTFDLRNNSFDLIRLVLALSVVVYHSPAIIGQGDAFILRIKDWNTYGTGLGTFAVYGFFAISGFLITASWLRSQSLQDFFSKRFWRIYPAFLACIFLASFVFVPLYYLLQAGGLVRVPRSIWREGFLYFTQNLTIEIRKSGIEGLQYSTLDLNGPLWTLLQEVRAYILIPILGYFGVFIHRYKLLVVTGFVLNIYVLGALNEGVRLLLNSLFFDFRFFVLFAYFLIGSCFYVYLDKIKWSYGYFFLAVILILAGVGFNIFPILAPIPIVYSILFLSQVLPLQNLSKKIGDWSYGVYIYSSLIESSLRYVNFGQNGYLPSVLVSVLLSLLAGFLSWHLVEKQFLKSKVKL